MNNFELIKTDCEKYKMIILMKTYEAPFQYLNEISEALKKINYIGTVLIDELMHSGNNNDRFIKGFFNGEQFDKKQFSFEPIERRSNIRKYSCDFLRNELDIADYSILNSNQRKLISKGIYI